MCWCGTKCLVESGELSHALNVEGSIHTGRAGGRCAPRPLGRCAMLEILMAAGLGARPGVLPQRQRHWDVGDAAALILAQSQEMPGSEHWSSTLGCSTTPWEVAGKKSFISVLLLLSLRPELRIKLSKHQYNCFPSWEIRIIQNNVQ